MNLALAIIDENSEKIDRLIKNMYPELTEVEAGFLAAQFKIFLQNWTQTYSMTTFE